MWCMGYWHVCFYSWTWNTAGLLARRLKKWKNINRSICRIVLLLCAQLPLHCSNTFSPTASQKLCSPSRRRKVRWGVVVHKTFQELHRKTVSQRSQLVQREPSLQKPRNPSGGKFSQLKIFIFVFSPVSTSSVRLKTKTKEKCFVKWVTICLVVLKTKQKFLREYCFSFSHKKKKEKKN